jgi:hypothetical protein
MIERWEWFTTARRVRAIVTREPDQGLILPLMFWPTSEIATPGADPATLNGDAVGAGHHGTPGDVPRHCEEPGAEATQRDIIDRFIEHGGYRIVPTDEEYQAKVEVDIDPEMVTAELAEIYRKQGLDAEAEKIYRILNAR